MAAYLIRAFREAIPASRILILDTKPRWRATHLPTGSSTKRRYKRFVKGDEIAGSMLMDDMRDWNLVWDKDVNPSRTVVVQAPHGSTSRAKVLLSLRAAERFFDTQDARRPSLIYFDEGMDFFTTSGSARDNSDVVQRCFRAGRELNLTSLIGVQRPKGINLQCLTETSYCALYRINFADDVKRLHEMGWPKNVQAPEYGPDGQETHVFRLWREGRPGAAPYRLSMKKGQ